MCYCSFAPRHRYIDSIWIWHSVDKWTYKTQAQKYTQKKKEFIVISSAADQHLILLCLSFFGFWISHTCRAVFIMCHISLSFFCSKRSVFHAVWCLFAWKWYNRTVGLNKQLLIISFSLSRVHIQFVGNNAWIHTVLAWITLTHCTFNTNWYWSELIWL